MEHPAPKGNLLQGRAKHQKLLGESTKVEKWFCVIQKVHWLFIWMDAEPDDFGSW